MGIPAAHQDFVDYMQWISICSIIASLIRVAICHDILEWDKVASLLCEVRVTGSGYVRQDMHLLLKLDSILSIFAKSFNCKNSEFKVLESFPV